MRVLRDIWRAWRYGFTWPIMLLALSVSASAQTVQPSPQGLTAQFSSTCSAATCATWAVGVASSVGVSVTGAGSWTGTFYASSDGGNSYFVVSVVNLADGSSTTTVTDTQDGQYSIANSGITHLQFRLTTWASGGANVWAVRGYATARWLTPFFRALTISQGTLTADQSAISTTATWNNAGVTFTHWKAVITDTASAAGSLALSLKGGAAGATNLFSVDKSGNGTFGNSVAAGGQLSAGTNVFAGATGRIAWTSSSRLVAPSDGVVTLSNAAETDFSRLQFGGTTSSFPALKRSGTTVAVRLADDSADGNLSGSAATFAQFNASSGGGFSNVGVYFMRSTAPTIASGFGTSPSIVASNGTAAFTVNVGTGGVATAGVLTFPAATTGWAVVCQNITANTATVFVTKQTAFTTTSATIGNYDAAGAAAAWTASNVLVCKATAF